MNTKPNQIKHVILAALTALALAPSASFAAPDLLIQPVGATVMSDGFGNQCNSSGGGGTWQNWYINSPGIQDFAIYFDTTNPPPSGSTGSMLIAQRWDGTSGGSEVTYACIDGN